MKRTTLSLLFLLCLTSVWAQKQIVWNQPTTEAGIYGDGFFKIAIDITRVEMNREETVLYMTINLRSDYPEFAKFKIQKVAHLIADGKHYPSRFIDGMEFDKWTNTEEGKKKIAIHFEPLPLDTRSFDFIEHDGKSALKIRGIKSIEESRKQLFPSYWRNENTGNWDIAFLDNGYTIYGGKIWNNELEVNHSSGEAKGILKRGDETLNVFIGKDKKGKRTIKIGKEKLLCSIITDRFMPDYPNKDSRTDFVDTNNKIDTVTVSGWIKDMPEEYRKIKTFDFCHDDIFTGEQKTFPAELDSLGRFTIKIPLINSTEFYCDWKRCMLSTVLEPGKSYFLLYDFKEGKRMWMGDDCRLQNELFKYPNEWGCLAMDNGVGYDEYINNVDSLLKSKYACIDDICRQHPTLSMRFNRFRKGVTLWRQARDFGQSRFSSKDHQLTSEALQYAYNTFWQRMEKPYTLYRGIDTFWNDYIDEAEGGVSSVSLNIREHIEELASTSEERDLLTVWSNWNENARAKVDAAEDLVEKERIKEELNAQIDEIDKKVNKLLEGTHAMKVIHSLLLEKHIQHRKECLDSLGADSLVKSILVAKLAFQKLDHEHRPLTDRLMDSLNVWINNPEVYTMIEARNNQYIALSKREFDKLELKSGADFQGMTEGKEILSKLLEPYKGKVVLIDVWGTWCAPCKEALQHSQEMYERLAKYNMEFVYLANRSPEDSWKTIIKEYNVSGNNVAHFNLPREQQHAIERYLQIQSFPTYKLVSKNGSILDIKVDVRDLNTLEELVRSLSAE